MDDEFSLRVGRICDQRPPAAGRLTPGRLARRGRGQKAVAALRQASRGRPLRRVIVKAKIVRLKPGSAAVRAHLRYLERGAGDSEDARGRLYDRAYDGVDGRAFLSRCDGDRHHFRFIVSPEDGADLDLQRFTRELMQRMEQDLGTVLDWVAVDHTDTAHPHSHILIRGRTDRGTDLLISQDYITEGLRLRARELATEELGMLKEFSRERFTRMDRQLIGRARDGVLGLRAPLTSQRTGLREGIAGARLETLRGFGLARPLSRDVWQLCDDLESELRRRGERGDIIKSMNRALARESQAREPETFVTHDQEQIPVIGRVIDKGLAGPTEERAALIVDGVDGKVRRVEMPLVAADAIPMRAIVQTGSGATVADHTIADIAGRSGVYDTTEHLRRLAISELPMPEGADPADVVRSHVRRLEALRRARIVTRYEEGRWRVPTDFLDQASAYEQRRGAARIISQLDLEAQIQSKGATWLDRELVARAHAARQPRLRRRGARCAAPSRADIVEQGHAQPTGAGVRYRAGLIQSLIQQELGVAGRDYARTAGRDFYTAVPGDEVRGIYRDRLDLQSGRFAVVEHGPGFYLVPWRPVIEPHRGREVTATIERGLGDSWTLGRTRQLGLGR